MPEMSRRSPSGKYILLPTTFKVPAVGAQPCRILKHRPDLLQDLDAQQGRGYPDLRLECKLATLPFERRGNYPCQISLVKAIRVRVRSLPTPWRTRPGSLSAYSRPKCKPFAERAGGILRPTNQGPQALKFGTKEGKLVSRSSVQHSRSTTSSALAVFHRSSS